MAQHITDYLLVGTALAAANVNVLRDQKITYVLNVKGGRYFNVDDIKHKIVPINDFGTDILANFYDECFSFIDEARAQKAKVLVHCQGGVNRSVSIVIAYLMTREGWNLRKAYQHVKMIRPNICPHENYFKQLQELDQKLYGSISLTEQERGGSMQEILRQLLIRARMDDVEQQ